MLGRGSPSNEALNFAVDPSSAKWRRGLIMKDGFDGRVELLKTHNQKHLAL